MMTEYFSINKKQKIIFNFTNTKDSLENKNVELFKKLKYAFNIANEQGLLTLLTSEKIDKSDNSINFFYNFTQSIISKIYIFLNTNELSTDPNKLKNSINISKNESQIYKRHFLAIKGHEYTDENFFKNLHDNFVNLLIKNFKKECNKKSINFKDFLNSLFGNKFQDVGTIAFHLAENKHLNKEKFPFVFMATIVNNFDEQKNNKHIPIATALKKYANQKEYIISLLDPLQKIAIKNNFLKELIDSKEIFKPLYLNSNKAYNFLDAMELLEKHNIILKLPNIWKKKQPKRLKIEVNFSKDSSNTKTSAVGFNSMLNFSFKKCLNKLQLSEEDFKSLLEQSKNSNLIQFKGEWIIAERDKINALIASWEKLTELAENGLPFFTGLRLIAKSRSKLLTSNKNNIAVINAVENCQELIENAPNNIEFSFNEKLKDFLNNFDSNKNIPRLSPKITKLIRPYQNDGITWLWKMSQMGMGCCLADDMGLGKTLQVLAFLEMQKRSIKQKCSLLVVPASLLKNWKNECTKFTPNLKMGILHSMELNQTELTELKNEPKNFIEKNSFDIVITTYQMLQRLNKVQELSWQNIIIDEAQAIKNPTSQQSIMVRNLKGSFRIALTGTPIENSLFDLWSIFDFINPTLLGTITDFKNFIKNIEEKASNDDENIIDYSPVRQLTAPFILRRLKTDKKIINDLPDKSEINVYCNLEKKQLQLYQRAVRSLAIELKEYSKEKNNNDDNEQNNQRNGLIFKYLMAFKQICNHPAHFTGSGNYEHNESGKFSKLFSIAEKVAERQDKILVFTQFKEMIEPIYDLLASIFNTEGLILHGGTSIKKRGELVDMFQNSDDYPFFVLSLKAAGTGLNLTAANHVVHFDRWWNPAVENQATDRAYRIGQHQNVLVHKFVTMNTIEERIANLIDQKATLANNLFSSTAEKLLTEMNDKELLEFITLDEY